MCLFCIGLHVLHPVLFHSVAEIFHYLQYFAPDVVKAYHQGKHEGPMRKEQTANQVILAPPPEQHSFLKALPESFISVINVSSTINLTFMEQYSREFVV